MNCSTVDIHSKGLIIPKILSSSSRKKDIVSTLCGIQELYVLIWGSCLFSADFRMTILNSLFILAKLYDAPPNFARLFELLILGPPESSLTTEALWPINLTSTIWICQSVGRA
jgi:hypothetical protein